MVKEGSNASERMLVTETLRADQQQNGESPALDKLSHPPEWRLMTPQEEQAAIAQGEAGRPKWASDEMGPRSGWTEGRNFRTTSGSQKGK